MLSKKILLISFIQLGCVSYVNTKTHTLESGVVVHDVECKIDPRHIDRDNCLHEAHRLCPKGFHIVPMHPTDSFRFKTKERYICKGQKFGLLE